MDTFIGLWRCPLLLAAEIKPWIVDSLVEYTGEDVNEVFFYQEDILKCEFAFIELTLKEDVVYDPVHQGRYTGRGRICKDPGRGLHCICHHYKGGHPRLGLRSLVAVVLLRERRTMLMMFHYVIALLRGL